MKILYLDIETFCEVPITSGTFRYAEEAEVIMLQYAIDDESVSVIDEFSEKVFTDLQEKINACEKIVIHNAAFERAVLENFGVEIPLEKTFCTMACAMAHSLPGSLDSLSGILGLEKDKAKDKKGKSLIQLFCKPLGKNRKLARATKETHPQEWTDFCEYGRLDIEATREIYKKIPQWNYRGAEKKLWELDQKINARGVKVDIELAEKAVEACEEALAEHNANIFEMSNKTIKSANQRDKILEFILEEFGYFSEDLKASTVATILQDENIPPALRDLLELRADTSKTSVAKYKRLLKCATKDGRLKGLLAFCGALRTGRWSGRLFQPQNLARPTFKKYKVIEDGIEAIKKGCADVLCKSPIVMSSNALRSVLVADEGKKLVIADLSNIEGRVLAWDAREDWKVQAFKDFDAGIGPDLYVAAYAKAFGIKVEDVTDAQRQVGKVMELALGYAGGVGAFLTFALVYRIDLEKLAVTARDNIPARIWEESVNFYEYSREKNLKNVANISSEIFCVCDSLKRMWREAHPKTCAHWKNLENLFFSATENPGILFEREHLKVRRDGDWLRMSLPSGRYLCYPFPQIREEKFYYKGVNQFSRKWEFISSYGGKLVENRTQAIARDVLAYNMSRVEKEGYEILLTVHDELITQTSNNEKFNAEKLSSLMCAPLPWASNLPLAAKGFEAYRYRKD